MLPILEIEKIILSTFLNDYESFIEFHHKLNSSNFYSTQHRALFNAMQELHSENKPIDDLFLAKKTSEKDVLEILTVTPISNISPYIDDFLEESKKRDLKEQLNLLRLNEELTSNEILNKLEIISTTKSIKNHIFDIKNTINLIPEKPEFYLSEILPIQKNEITILSASGGVGKSYTALYLLGLMQNQGIKTLGYFSEDSIGLTKHRLVNLMKIHNNLKDIDIIGKDSRLQPFIEFDSKKNLKATDFFYNFKHAAKNYEVILLDPLIALIANDENNNHEARYLMNLLNEWVAKEHKTILLIHHHSKSDESRGASAIVDAARLHYVLTIPENNHSQRLIKLKKTNHYSGKAEFIIQLFDNEKKTRINEHHTKKQKRQSTITIINDNITSEEGTALTKKLINKGIKFDD